jgi:hypothetical protein
MSTWFEWHHPLKPIYFKMLHGHPDWVANDQSFSPIEFH